MIYINEKLKKYIEENIFPEYNKNDKGHDIEHINYVIERSLKFAETVENINYDIVYTVSAYHDIGHHIDAKNHEKVSAEIFLKDQKIKSFFTEDQIKIIAEAIEDHRSSLEYEPRSVYGKIVSTADKNTSIDDVLKRTYSYYKKHKPDASLEEIIEDSRLHLIDKFGENGYANKKMYFDDKEFKQFLKDIIYYTENKEIFKKRYLEVNKLKK